MPSASGVYSLPSGYLAVTGQTIQASQHNPPLEDIAAALTNRLSRDGSAPMTGALQLVSGTVGAPAIVCAADASSGFYKTTNGIGVAIGGTKVSEFTAAGIASGAFLVGMLFPFTGSTAPSNLWLLPCGQTVSRTTYAALWAFAQTEIAAGNTFYNNGDGITNFGIGDLRGRTWAAKDNMGGTDAARLSNAASNIAAVRTTIGGAGGEVVHTLAAPEIPSITSANAAQAITVTTSQKVVNGPNQGSAPGGGSQVTAADSGSGGALSLLASTGNNSINVTSTNTSGAAHNNMQPTMLGNYILFAGGAS